MSDSNNTLTVSAALKAGAEVRMEEVPTVGQEMTGTVLTDGAVLLAPAKDGDRIDAIYGGDTEAGFHFAIPTEGAPEAPAS